MSRVARRQADLFAPSQPDLFAAAPGRPRETEADPLAALAEMLAMLRGADRLPWADLPATIAQEHRALYLGSLAGPDGARLAAAILDETERLFHTAEQRGQP